MVGLEAPFRKGAKYSRTSLLARDKETGELLNETPTTLDLAQIKESEEVFQQRGNSLTFAPGHSEEHIRYLSKCLGSGVKLDPVSVVAFGNQWYLVDGHHRLEAYRRQGITTSIPVKALQSDLRGTERIGWAVDQSLAENRKNRLNLTTSDRLDAAWRLTLADTERSKKEVANHCGVGTSTIAGMRSSARKLREAGFSDVELEDWPWRRASFELIRLDREDDDTTFEYQDAQRRKLAKQLTKPLASRAASAMLLLEVMEELRPGISIELETVIQMKREEERALEPDLEI